jgi:hypothetical protein
MTVKECPRLLVEARIDQEKQRGPQRQARLLWEQFPQDSPGQQARQPAQKQRENLPVDRDLWE